MTQQRLAELAGVSLSLLQKIESGAHPVAKLRPGTVAKIVQVFGDLRQNYERLAGALADGQQAELNAASRAARVKGDRGSRIPLINHCPAGEPRDFTDLGHPAGIADDYIDRGDVTDDLAFAFHVFGDSMEPEYRLGDVAVVGGGTTPKSGDDCFVRFAQDSPLHAGECTLKRVEFQDGTVLLRPLNLLHPVEVVSREHIEQCFPIIEVRRKMLRR